MWSTPKPGNAAPSRGPVPGTIRQVRGATYPPLTAPHTRSNSTGGTSNVVSGLLAQLKVGDSPAPAAAPAGAPAAPPVDISEPAAAARPAAASPASNSPAKHRRTPSSGGGGGTAAAATGASSSAAASTPMPIEVQRLRKFESLLAAEVVDLKALRAAAWSGVPLQCRATTWQLLLGYLPPNRAWRDSMLERKRREYYEAVPQYFDVPNDSRSDGHQKMLHQILIDVPRTAPSVKLFRHAKVQRALERILYIWALRHPASGYVQGINDLVTPFYFVFLSRFLPDRPCNEDDIDALSQAEVCRRLPSHLLTPLACRATVPAAPPVPSPPWWRRPRHARVSPLALLSHALGPRRCNSSMRSRPMRTGASRSSLTRSRTTTPIRSLGSSAWSSSSRISSAASTPRSTPTSMSRASSSFNSPSDG